MGAQTVVPERGATADLSDVRLHVVTGKGGVGKTTVAAALALGLAAGGHRALLVEVEGRQGIARLFDVPPLPYEERRIAVARGGGELYALAVEPAAALLDYLDLFYHLGRAGKALDKIGAVDFATTIAPGVRDVLLIGKCYEAVRRRDDGADHRAGSSRPGRPAYDAVVLDGPPTGRIAQFLNVNADLAGLATGGPIRHQADSIMELLRSAATAVHVVTLLEEMPVQEAVDAVAELRQLRLPVGTLVVNMVREPVLDPHTLGLAANGGLDPAEVRDGLVAAGVLPTGGACDAPMVTALLAQATEHAERVLLECGQRAEVARLDLPLVELPMVPGGLDLGGLYDLAEVLTEGVPARGAGSTS